MTKLEKEVLEYCNTFRRKPRKTLAKGSHDCCVDNVLSNTIGKIGGTQVLCFFNHLWFSDRKDGYDVEHPDFIREFLTRLDEGKYPHLEDKGDYYDN